MSVVYTVLKCNGSHPDVFKDKIQGLHWLNTFIYLSR